MSGFAPIEELDLTSDREYLRAARRVKSLILLNGLSLVVSLLE